MVRATLRTHPCSIAQRQRLVLPATDGAQSATWIPAISEGKLSTVAPGLVFQLRAQHPKAHVRDGASESLVREHPLDVYILDHERLVFAAESSRELVGEIRSEIGKAGMQPCQCRSGRSPVVRYRQARSFGQAGTAFTSCCLLGGLQLAAETSATDV